MRASCVLVAATVALLFLWPTNERLNLRQLFWYDDSYLLKLLEERYPYLKRAEGGYVAPRDYFNFSHVFKPSSEYLAATSLERHLYEELRALEVTTQYSSLDVWHYSDERHAVELDRLAKTDEQKCKTTLESLASRLKEAEKLADSETSRQSLFSPGRSNLNLLRWIDSWGRPESETYFGNSYWTGSFRGCQYAAEDGDADDADESINRLEFRYCWAKLVAKSWPQNDETVPKISFRVGICLPKTCSNQVANKLNKTVLDIMQFNFSPTQRRRFNKIIHIYCLPINLKPTDHLAPLIFLAALLGWLSLITIVSVCRLTREKRRKNGTTLIDCLTIQENFAALASDDEPPPKSRVDLRPSAFIKLLACVLVCFGHCFGESYTHFRSSSIPILMQNKLELHLNIFHALGFVFKSLDMFMIVGSILTAYTILVKFPRKRINQLLDPLQFAQLNILRLLRLIPILILVLLFNKTIYVYLSDGPFWDYGTSKLTTFGKCRLEETWTRQMFVPLLFDVFGLSGQTPYLSNCANFSWYIVATTRTFLVVPLFLYLFSKNKKPLTRFRLTLIVVILSTIWQFKDFYLQELVYYEQLFVYGRLAANFMLYSHSESSYYSLLNRFYCIAIGLFAGHYLVEYKRNNLNKWPKWMYGNYLKLALVWHLIDFVVPILHAQTNFVPSETLVMLCAVLKTRLDAVTFAIFSLRMVTDLAPQIMRNTNALYKLSKLSYCVYLVHYNFLSYSLTATEKSRPDTIPLQLFMIFAFVILSSFIISFPIHLMFQSPLELMLKRLTQNRTPKLTTPSDDKWRKQN